MYPSLMGSTAHRPQLRDRYEREAQPLASPTVWNIADIRKSMNIASWPTGDEKKWYQRLWGNYRRGEGGRINPVSLKQARRIWRVVSAPCHLLGQSPVRFPSTRIVTRIPFPAVGVAFRTTENEVLETVPSTRVMAWGPSMS